MYFCSSINLINLYVLKLITYATCLIHYYNINCNTMTATKIDSILTIVASDL